MLSNAIDPDATPRRAWQNLGCSKQLQREALINAFRHKFADSVTPHEQSFRMIHMALQRPSRVEAMVVVAGAHRVSAAGRALPDGPEMEDMPHPLLDYYRRQHAGRAAQVRSSFARLRPMADSYDDFDTSPEHLATIEARALFVWGDGDVVYPVDLALEMYRAISGAAI